MRSHPLKAASHFVALRNLFLDCKVQIRERRSHAAKNILQTIQPRTLTGKWNLLDDVLPNKPCSRVDIALCDHFLYKPPDHRGIILCAQSALLKGVGDSIIRRLVLSSPLCAERIPDCAKSTRHTESGGYEFRLWEVTPAKR